MPVHPNLRKSLLTPKEKAIELAAKFKGYYQPDKEEPSYSVPLSISQRERIIITAQILSSSKNLSKEDRTWWSEIAKELKKLPFE